LPLKAKSKEEKLPKSGKYLALLNKTVFKSSEINTFHTGQGGQKDYRCLVFGRRTVQTSASTSNILTDFHCFSSVPKPDDEIIS
jgi:hypothetical protein